ncbi:hypothetical protein GCM10023205_60480 [Yinghuangia aomiensis]|uniref:DUF397 domain-containing protein n=1 Tax=Yinghuangia aomiensis TaxID=676205 RepID=A0ABP9HZQ4_9ACTN
MSTPNGAAQKWRKSSYSTGDGGNCVEVADGLHGVVPVRDSKDPQRRTLVVPVSSWVALTSTVKR